MFFRTIAALLLLLAPSAYALPNCDPCTIADGSYRAIAPPGWNGTDRLPVLVFLHGWQADGDDMVSDPAISGPAAALNFLLIAPDGVGKSWSFSGSPSKAKGRDDIAFVRVLS